VGKVIKLLRRLFRTSEGGKVHPSTDQPIGQEDPLQELREAIINKETRPAVLHTLRKLNEKERLEGGYRDLLDLLEAEEGMEKDSMHLVSSPLEKELSLSRSLVA